MLNNNNNMHAKWFAISTGFLSFGWPTDTFKIFQEIKVITVRQMGRYE
jgi:hypothetical protein